MHYKTIISSVSLVSVKRVLNASLFTAFTQLALETHNVKSEGKIEIRMESGLLLYDLFAPGGC